MLDCRCAASSTSVVCRAEDLPAARGASHLSWSTRTMWLRGWTLIFMTDWESVFDNITSMKGYKAFWLTMSLIYFGKMHEIYHGTRFYERHHLLVKQETEGRWVHWESAIFMDWPTLFADPPSSTTSTGRRRNCTRRTRCSFRSETISGMLCYPIPATLMTLNDCRILLVRGGGLQGLIRMLDTTTFRTNFKNKVILLL